MPAGSVAAPPASAVRAERLPPHALMLIGGAAAVAAAAALITVPVMPAPDWRALLLLAALGIAAERFEIDLYGDSKVSVSAIFLLTAAIIVGPVGALMSGAAVALGGHLGRGRPLYKLVFNVGLFVDAGLTSAWVYRGLVTLDVPGTPYLVAAALAAAMAHYAVSTCLVTLIIASTSGGRPASVFREKFAWLWPHFLLIGFLASVLGFAYKQLGVLGLLGFVAPAFTMRLAMKQYTDRTERTVTELRQKHAEVQSLSIELESAYNETLHTLVAALDMRDTETHGHSQRVTGLSLTIAEHLGIPRGSRDWLDLKHGAMLHDVGKIGVADAILRKRGPLSSEEMTEIRKHPRDGYNMLRDVRFLARAAELVLCHHERFDGTGYPRGVAAGDIPLGARIFAVADTFDAITSRRPYKPAYDEDYALAEIAANSGTQFDPRVVDVLLKLKGWHPGARKAA